MSASVAKAHIAPSALQSKCCRCDTTGKTPAGFQKRPVKPSLQKYFCFRNKEIMIKRSHPALTKEALRHRHETWCGMRWTLLVRQANALRRTVKPCGPDSPMLGSSLPTGRRRGLTSPVPRGERGVSRKAIAQGVPDRFGLPDYLVGTLPLSAHKPAGAASARHSLRPLFREGHRMATPGREIASRECG